MADAFKILGDKELLETLGYLDARATKDVMKPAVSKGLTPVNKEAKRLVPRDEGQLRKSIGKRVRARRNKVIGRITIRKGFKGSAKIAHMHEFGTSRMPARAFMRKALYNKRQTTLSIVQKEAWRNINIQVDKAVDRGQLRRLVGGGLRRLL